MNRAVMSTHSESATFGDHDGVYGRTFDEDRALRDRRRGIGLRQLAIIGAAIERQMERVNDLERQRGFELARGLTGQFLDTAAGVDLPSGELLKFIALGAVEGNLQNTGIIIFRIDRRVGAESLDRRGEEVARLEA